MIQHRNYHLTGDDMDEPTLMISHFKDREEVPPKEAVKWARGIIRDLKANITELEREILWVTDREKHFTYYEDRKKTLDNTK